VPVCDRYQRSLLSETRARDYQIAFAVVAAAGVHASGGAGSEAHTSAISAPKCQSRERRPLTLSFALGSSPVRSSIAIGEP